MADPAAVVVFHGTFVDPAAAAARKGWLHVAEGRVDAIEHGAFDAWDDEALGIMTSGRRPAFG